MKYLKICILALCCVWISGCQRTVRPISNSSYPDNKQGIGHIPDQTKEPTGYTAYQGELSEFDVLGITRGQAVSESEIARALEQAKAVKLKPNSSILLIQSG